MSRDRKPRFEGVILDMGDILYDASVWRRWLTDELQKHDVRITYPELVEQWEALLVDVYRGQAEYWSRFETLLHQVGLPGEATSRVGQAARRKAQEVQVDRQPMEEVPETLKHLDEAGVKLAVLSDTESGSRKVRGILNQLGIEEVFEAVVTSADIGQVKPHPEAFRTAVSALNLETSRCAFVGHDIDELEGAQRADLYAIAYNYHPDAPADVYLERFGQLKDVVLEA